MIWTISSGQEVMIGDLVALEFHPDEVGIIIGAHPNGKPVVQVTRGPNSGKTRESVSPNEILMKVPFGEVSS